MSMNRQIYAEASEWLVEFRSEEVDQATRKGFQRWLSKSPEHVRAYLEVSGIWETIGAQGPADPQDIEALIERARQAPANVLPLMGMGESSGVPRARRSGSALARDRDDPTSREVGKLRYSIFSRRAFSPVVAFAMVAIIGLGAYLYAHRDVYATAIGEQRSLLLADGSTIDLNARSRIRVRFGEHERSIDLLEGQALFRVAKDKRRPFVVAVNGTFVRAVGTQFDVNERKREVVVTVVEGTVAVGSPSGDVKSRVTSVGAGEILVSAGQQLTVAAVEAVGMGTDSAPKPQSADVVTATAWTQRRLIFDSTPLDEVAEEFNRNNTRPLVIQGEGLQDFHVSGAFSSSDPEPLLRFLRAQPGIRVSDEGQRIVVSRSD